MHSEIKIYLCKYFIVILGIQRPLKDICEMTQSIYIPKGINTSALDTHMKWDFQPQSIKVRIHVFFYLTNFLSHCRKINLGRL